MYTIVLNKIPISTINFVLKKISSYFPNSHTKFLSCSILLLIFFYFFIFSFFLSRWSFTSGFLFSNLFPMLGIYKNITFLIYVLWCFYLPFFHSLVFNFLFPFYFFKIFSRRYARIGFHFPSVIYFEFQHTIYPLHQPYMLFLRKVE